MGNGGQLMPTEIMVASKFIFAFFSIQVIMLYSFVQKVQASELNNNAKCMAMFILKCF